MKNRIKNSSRNTAMIKILKKEEGRRKTNIDILHSIMNSLGFRNKT
jgi:hypothetical protein